MRVEEYCITTSNFRLSVEFYSRLFSSTPSISEGRASFANGIVIYSEEEWRKRLSLPFDFTFSRTLSSSIVLVTDNFSSFLLCLKDPFFDSHILSRKSKEVIVIDDDLNCLIIIDSGLESASINNDTLLMSGEKRLSSSSDNWKK